MAQTRDRIPADPTESRGDPDFDLDSLLHPTQAFDHPMDVARDPDLTPQRKARDPRLLGVGCLRGGLGAAASARTEWPRRDV